jgi:SAM-dependent methyltransferase
MDYPKSDYKEYPQTLSRNDFWGQVRRTQYGQRISESEVHAMVVAIREGLRLRRHDIVLDLACGNGALSVRLFTDCSGWLGVDSSEYLIEIAQENFERLPEYKFLVGDVCDYVKSEADPERFTCGLCYGSFSYLAVPSGRDLLETLRDRFVRLNRLFVGNIPDKNRATSFYPEGSGRGLWLDRRLFTYAGARLQCEVQIRCRPGAKAVVSTAFVSLPGAGGRPGVSSKEHHRATAKP